MWVKPRKVNEVPSVSGWLVPFGRLLRKSTNRVLSGWSVSPYRARRLPKTLRTRLASRISSNAITASSAKRIRVHLPLRRGRTSVSNHSSSTWCRKMFERQGEITPPWGEPSVAWRRRPSSRTPAWLFRLHSGGPNNFAPLFGFFDNELSEVGRRAREHGSTQFGITSLDFGIRKAGSDFFIESFDDVGGRVFGRSDPKPTARFIAR